MLSQRGRDAYIRRLGFDRSATTSISMLMVLEVLGLMVRVGLR
jgi:hypothetical protein